MNLLRKLIVCSSALVMMTGMISGQGKHEISVKGTQFLMNGEPFEFTGISFFNALCNEEFNKNTEAGRLVTNSPGYGGFLGKNEENRALDYHDEVFSFLKNRSRYLKQIR